MRGIRFEPPGVTIDDAALLDAFCRDGDPAAFDELYDRLTPRIYSLALRLTGGSSDGAEDVVQETWMRMVRARTRYSGRGSVVSWVLGITVNCAREWNRSGARHDACSLSDHSASRDRALNATGDRIDLRRALAGLAPGYREVLILHDVVGLTHAEIAAMTGVEEGTSKSQLSRARRAMRAALGRP